MPARLQCVALDCPEPVVLARFYQALLGGEVNRPDPRWRVDEDWATLHVDDLVLGFQRAPDHRPPRWPDPAFPQQFHLDFEVDEFEPEHERLTALGATLQKRFSKGDGYGWHIYTDPIGHPFCLCRNKGVVWQDGNPIYPS